MVWKMNLSGGRQITIRSKIRQETNRRLEKLISYLKPNLTCGLTTKKQTMTLQLFSNFCMKKIIDSFNIKYV